MSSKNRYGCSPHSPDDLSTQELQPGACSIQTYAYGAKMGRPDLTWGIECSYASQDGMRNVEVDCDIDKDPITMVVG